MRKFRNKGIPPKDPTVELGIEWANGKEATRTYRAEQLNFAIRGWDYDIAFFWRVDGKFEDEAEDQDQLKRAG